MKVFCRNCNHLKLIIFERPKCSHPNNRKSRPNWYEDGYKVIRHPWRINKYNDCKWHRVGAVGDEL